MPEQSYPYERPTPGELADQLAKCAKGIEDWKKTSGRVDYPRTLTVQTGQSTTYNAAIDISDTPQPPESVIVVPTGEPTARSITVKCAVAAHLVPTEGDVTVNPSPDTWVAREFDPAGVVSWQWTITAPTTTDARVMLEIQPAHLDNGVPLTAGTQVAQVFTQVQVTSTWIDRLSEWFKDQWPKLVGIVAAVAGALVVAIKWLGLPWPPTKWFSKSKRAAAAPRTSRRRTRKRRTTATTPDSGPTAKPPDKTPTGTR